MDTMSKVEKELHEALQRLINGQTEVVDTTSSQFRISNNMVAKEAGRPSGTIRATRYPELCLEIERAEKARAATPRGKKKASGAIAREKTAKANAQAKAKELETDVETLQNALLNVIRENYHLRRELQKFKDQGKGIADNELHDLIFKAPDYKKVH